MGSTSSIDANQKYKELTNSKFSLVNINGFFCIILERNSTEGAFSNQY
jgi:hypothetical protein